MATLALIFAGAFLFNCIPHLAAGLQGQPFPTPFATPRGVGNSSQLVNALWGTFNLGVGLVLLTRQPITVAADLDCLALLAGALGLGGYLALHFGKVVEARRGR